jgi:hypothetical protein
MKNNKVRLNKLVTVSKINKQNLRTERRVHSLKLKIKQATTIHKEKGLNLQENHY